jgi:RNA polymerase sigma-70 factor (ECF subfamily)
VPRNKEQIYRELLAVRCRLGEREAFEELVRLWEPRLLYFIRRFVSNDQDALDVLQQTWIKALGKIGTLHDAASIAPWLYRIARNTALNHSRLEATYRAALEHEQNGKLAGGTPAAGEAQFDNAEQVHYGLSRLPLPQRELLTLHFLNDLSIAEIAHVLDAPEGTIKSRLFHARAALRRVLEE